MCRVLLLAKRAYDAMHLLFVVEMLLISVNLLNEHWFAWFQTCCLLLLASLLDCQESPAPRARYLCCIHAFQRNSVSEQQAQAITLMMHPISSPRLLSVISCTTNRLSVWGKMSLCRSRAQAASGWLERLFTRRIVRPNLSWLCNEAILTKLLFLLEMTRTNPNPCQPMEHL